MKMDFINQQKPKAAIVAQSPFDDEGILLPLCPETQAAWSRRARRNVGGSKFHVLICQPGRQMEMHEVQLN